MDLDETLVHTCSLKENPDNIIKTNGDFGEEITVFIIYLMIFWDFLLNFIAFFSLALI